MPMLPSPCIEASHFFGDTKKKEEVIWVMGRHALVSPEPGQHNPKRQRGKKQQPRNFYENSLPWKNKFNSALLTTKKIS